MFPWLWLWAPQLNFPWSGNVAQSIEPETTWFTSLIRPGAGDARIEKKAFMVASYGKQLGLLTEVLIEIAEKSKGLSPVASASLENLRRIKAAIEEIKSEAHQSAVTRLTAEIESIRQRGGPEYEELVQGLRPLLSEAKSRQPG